MVDLAADEELTDQLSVQHGEFDNDYSLITFLMLTVIPGCHMLCSALENVLGKPI